jgi:deazaflavin-dependent oxidoreductase (nitroreductase family)
MDWNKKIIEEFRTNNGKVGGNFEGAPLLLLHTKGAKTGEVRVNPLMYRQDGERLVVFASKGGAPTNPDWYYNVLANPTVAAEVGQEKARFLARVATGEERDKLWSKQKQEWPNFAQYEEKTKREIPVIILEPSAD